MYRVHFKWKEKEISLQARSLDLTHPYFVSIKELVFPTGKKIIINPSESFSWSAPVVWGRLRLDWQ